MDSFIDRIQYFMLQTGINNNQMTVAAGLSVGLIGRAIKSKSGLNSDSIEKILYAYPELNPNWLLTGRGEMLITNKQEEINAKANAKVNAKVASKNDKSLDDAKEYPTEYSDAPLSIVGECEQLPYGTKEVKVKISKEQLHMPNFLQQRSKTSVPFYNLPVSAGMLGVLESEVFPQNTPDGFLELSAFNGCEAVFPIIGVSMEPIISSGDWIGIKSIDNISRSWDFIQTNVIYLIITREDRMIKFIDKATDEDFIVCRSANASPFKVYKGDILKLYRVKACVKDL